MMTAECYYQFSGQTYRYERYFMLEQPTSGYCLSSIIFHELTEKKILFKIQLSWKELTVFRLRL